MTLVQFVAFITPQSMYELFPMAALLGSLMGMGGLSANVDDDGSGDGIRAVWYPCRPPALSHYRVLFFW